MKNLPTPPRWADRFFEWYCNPELREEIQGDLYERFQRKVEKKGLRKARRWYWINVILFMNKYTLRRKRSYSPSRTSFDLFGNYLKVGLRNIQKNKLTTLINALGMSLAIGCCLVAFTFLDGIYNLDSFHDKRDEIYVLEHWFSQNDRTILRSNIPIPLAERIASDFPTVEKVARLRYAGSIAQYQDKVFREWISFIDPAFFDLFDFPLKYGSTDGFGEQPSVILRQEIAAKYFGADDPVGKTMDIRFTTPEGERKASFIVQAVLDQRPVNASFNFGILVPFDRQQWLGLADLQDWAQDADITFLQIPQAAAIDQIHRRQAAYLAPFNTSREGGQVEALHLQPLRGIAHRALQPDNAQFYSVHSAAIILLALIVVVLLILVCLNYMNIAIASATTRFREISVRKVMGGNRRSIIWQFITENVLICLIALLLGIFLARSLFLPWFNELSTTAFSLNFRENWRLWLFLTTLILITAIGGAGYPAFYLSALRPVAILKGMWKVDQKHRLRKILLGIQFFLTFIALFTAVALLQEGNVLKQQDWGYQKESLMVLNLEHGENSEILSEALRANSNVLRVAGSQHQMGYGAGTVELMVEGQQRPVNEMRIGPDFIETLAINIQKGRSFKAGQQVDGKENIMVNEALTRQIGWTDPVGKSVKIDGRQHHIVGLVNDFHFYPFNREVEPLVLRLAENDQIRYLTVRIRPGRVEQATKEIEAIWKQMYPNTPYDYFFLDSVFDNYFRGLTQLTRVLTATASLTIFISMIGLFGLTMLIIAHKMKELSIRKILGAGPWQISYLINREFLITLVWSGILGAPLGYLLANSLTRIFTFRSTVELSAFLISFAALFVIIFFSVGWHMYRIITLAPGKFIRNE